MNALFQFASAKTRDLRYMLVRRWRRAAMAAVIVALIPVSVVAAELVRGDEIIVTAPVSGDLYLFGSDILIDAPVDGDVIAAAGRVQINGSVTGSVHALAGDVIVRGDVGGNVMAAGGTVIVTGRVGHALRAAAGNVRLEGASIDGDFVVAATDLTMSERTVVSGQTLLRANNAALAGSMAGGLQGSARHLRVSGQIGAPSAVTVRTLRFMDGALVDQPFEYTSDHEMLVDGGTTITGAITRLTPDHRTFGETISRSLLFALFRFGWALATGWLLLKYMPQTLLGVSDTLRLAPARSLLWGLLGIFGTPLVAVVTAVTVIGIPISLILLALYLFALYASQLVVGMVLGVVISRNRWRTVDGSPAHLRTLAAGLAIIVLVRSLPLDGWYPLVAIATATIALGAIIIYFFRPRLHESQATAI